MTREPERTAQLRVWAHRALAALPTEKSMARWIVIHRYRLAELDWAIPPLCQDIRTAIAARWDELDAAAQPNEGAPHGE